MSKSLPCIIISIFIAGCAGNNIVLTGSPLPETPRYKPAAAEEASYEIEEPVGPVTLKQALALTLLKNPALKASNYEVRAAEARALQAALSPNPELEIEVENFAGSGAMSGFDSAETTVAISQLLELGNKAQKRKNVASLETQMSSLDYKAARNEIVAGAAKAFIDLLAAQQRSELLSEMVTAAELAENIAAQRVAAGKDSPLEKTKASVALTTAKIEYELAATELEKAGKTLASFWGAEQASFECAKGDLSSVPKIPQLEFLTQELANSPLIERAVSEIARDEAALELEKAKTRQDISIAGGFRQFNDTDDSAFVLGLSIPLPVNNRNQGARMEAAAKLSRSRELQQAVRLDAVNRLHSLHANLTGAVKSVEQLRTTVLPGAKEVLLAAQEAYKLGKYEYFYVLDAQRTYFAARSAYLDALVCAHKAAIDLQELTGQNTNIKHEQTELTNE